MRFKGSRTEEQNRGVLNTSQELAAKSGGVQASPKFASRWAHWRLCQFGQRSHSTWVTTLLVTILPNGRKNIRLTRYQTKHIKLSFDKIVVKRDPYPNNSSKIYQLVRKMRWYWVIFLPMNFGAERDFKILKILG